MTSDKLKQISLRNEYIHNLTQFISSSKFQIKETLVQLNWSEDRTIFKESEKLTTCPLNEEHRVSVKNLAKHEETCTWHQQGYRDNDVPLPPERPSTVATVRIDKTLQEQIIADAAASDPSFKLGVVCPAGDNVRSRGRPQTAERWFSDFTSDERRVLHDFVIAKTASQLPELKEFALPAQTEGKAEMSREQLMRAERDAKRRRVKYRTAKVKGKNYCEVMREVINNQMQAYEDWLREQEGVSPDLPAGIEPEKKQTVVEQKKEKEEMIWIEYDRRVNPYLRWKYLLEKEKRRAKEKETEKNDVKNDKAKDLGSRRMEREDDSRYKRKGERNHDDDRDRDKRRRYEDRHERTSVRDKHSYEKDRHRNKSYSSYEKSGRERGHSRHDFRERDRHKKYEDSHKEKKHENREKDPKEKSRKSEFDKDDKCSLQTALAKVKQELVDETGVDFKNGNTAEQIQLLYEHFVTKKEKNGASTSEEKSRKVPKHKKKHRKSKKSKKQKHKRKKKKRSSSSSSDSSDSSSDDSDDK